MGEKGELVDQVWAKLSLGLRQEGTCPRQGQVGRHSEERGIREHLGRLTPFQTNLDPDTL